jgi:hypothetical protein
MKNEITVAKFEDGTIYLCKRLDDDPKGKALGMTFVNKENVSDLELGEAVREMLNDKNT